MRYIIKPLILSWLAFTAIFMWVALAVVNMILSMIGWHILAAFTPLIGVSIMFCIIKYGIQVYKHEGLFGQKKI